MDTSRPIATITLEIEIHLDSEPTISTPDVYEPGYDYLAVRGVKHLSTTTFGDTGPLQLVQQAGFDDHDPDGLIESTLTNALDPQEKTMTTRSAYLRSEITHADYYAQFVTEETRSVIERTFGKETLAAALRQDRHLNSIDMRSWDAVSWYPINADDSYRRADLRSDSGRFRAGIPFDRAATEAAGETITRAVLVCIAKEAARQVVEGKPEQA